MCSYSSDSGTCGLGPEKSNDKRNRFAVLLSALVLFSVFAGAGAIIDPVAAANVNVADGVAETNTNHQWSTTVESGVDTNLTAVSLDYTGTGADLRKLDPNTVEVAVNGEEQTVDSVALSLEGNSIQLQLASGEPILAGDVVTVSTTENVLQNPPTAGTYSASLELGNETGLVQTETTEFGISSIPEAPYVQRGDTIYNSSMNSTIAVTYNVTGVIEPSNLAVDLVTDDTGFVATNSSLSAAKGSAEVTIPSGTIFGNKETLYVLRNTTSDDISASHAAWLNDTAEQPPTGTLNGTVTDSETGSAIEGVPVGFVRNDVVVTTTTTDASGAYSAELAANQYDVIFDASGYNFEFVSDVSVSENTTTTIDQSLTPESTTGTLDGTVVDSTTGNAISGATVSVSQNGTVVDGTTTNTMGGYALELPTGEYNVTFSADDYNPETVTGVPISENATTTLNTSLDPSSAGTFAVSITETNSPVEQGEFLTVNTTVENQGNADSTQTVVLSLNGSEVDSRTVSLAGGESTTVTFYYVTNSSDIGEYVATVASEDDSASTGVEVTSSSQEISGPTGTLTGTVVDTETGEPIENAFVLGVSSDGVPQFNTTATNADGEFSMDLSAGANDVRVEASGYGSEIRTGITINENETTTESFSLGEAQTGTINGTVTDESGLHVADAYVYAYEPNTYVLKSATQTGPAGQYSLEVGAGEADLFVYADGFDTAYRETVPVSENQTTTENVGLSTETTGTLSGTVVDAETGEPVEGATVSALPTDRQSFGNGTTTDANGEYSMELGAAEYELYVDDGDSLESRSGVTVTENQTTSFDIELGTEQTSNFDVAIQSTNSPVREGRTLAVEAAITNDGTIGDTQTIRLSLDGTEVASRTVSLDSGASTTVTFEYGTDGSDVGTNTLAVASEDTLDERTVEVDRRPQPEPANFAVRIDEATDPVLDGDSFEVTATVTNRGDQSDTQSVALTVGGTVRAEQSVSLGGGESATVTLTTTVTADDDGAAAELSSEDETASTTLSVDRPAALNIDVDAADSTPAGEEVTVSATVENVGDLATTETLTFAVNGSLEDTAELSLAGGQSSTETFTYTPAQTGTLEFTVSTNETTAVTTTVVTSTEVAVDPQSVDFGQVLLGNNATASVALENVGTEPVTLDTVRIRGGSNAFETDTGALELDPGEREERQIRFTPTDSGPASGTLVFDGDAVAVSELAGEGVEPAVDATPETLEFGSVSAGENTSREFELSTPLDVPVETRLQIEGSDADAFNLSTSRATVGAGQTVTETVTYEPSLPGADSATVMATSPDGTELSAIQIEGNATAPELAVDTNSIQFDDPTVGEAANRTLTISNDGDEPLGVTRAELAGHENFDLVGGGEFTLGPGEQRTLTITFLANETGLYSTYLYIETDAPADPNRVIGISTGEVEVDVTVDEQNRVTTNTRVRNATAGEQTDIELPDPVEEEGYETDEVSVTPEVDGDIELNLTSSSRPLETTPETDAGFENNTAMAGNISVDASLENDQIEEVGITTAVSLEQIQEWDSDPGNVSLYRFNESQQRWVEQRTELVEVTDEVARLRGVGDGFSEWTAAAARPSFEITQSDVSVETATVEESVLIDVFVRNTGGTEGTYVADLLLNGEVVDSKQSVIAEGGEALFDFERTFDQPGVYEVQVNDQLIRELEITDEQTVEDPGSDGGSEGDGSSDGDDDSESDGEDGTDDGSGDIFGDGFGFVIALLAVVLTVGIARRRS